VAAGKLALADGALDAGLDDLHPLNENDYHNGVHLQLTTATWRTGST